MRQAGGVSNEMERERRASDEVGDGRQSQGGKSIAALFRRGGQKGIHTKRGEQGDSSVKRTRSILLVLASLTFFFVYKGTFGDELLSRQ
jgi:hypothetical protein